MDDFELIGAIWEALAISPVARDVDFMMLEIGAEAAPVRTALAALRNAKLVEVTQQTPRLYRATVLLDAMKWAQAVALGVPLDVLEAHGKLQAKDRREALRLAADGAVERHHQAQVDEKRQTRERIRKDRAKSEAAATELGLLVSDARRSLEEKRTAKNTNDVTLFILEQLVQASESSLATLESSLLRG